MIACGLPLAESAEVVQVAVLPVTLALLQSAVTPSVKVTVPAPLGLGEIVAVNVTESPYVLGFLLLVTVVAVVWVVLTEMVAPPWLTACVESPW